MLSRFLSFAAVTMLALVVLAACGGDDEPEDVTRIPVEGAPVYETPSGTPGTDVAEATPGGGEGGGGEVAGTEFTVVSQDIAFDPKELAVPADTEVTVKLPNEGALPHNFSVDALSISVDIAPGAEESTTLTAPAGAHEYYCNVTGHKEAGMVGTLTAQ
jgi:plastocyanin